MRVHWLLALCCATSPLAAQTSVESASQSLAVAPQPRFASAVHEARTPVSTVRRQSGAAFPVELLGATAGSLIGLGAGLLIASPDDCNNEDIACILQRIGFAGLLSVAAAPAGTMLAGRWADTRPHLLGAALGSIAGVAAGAGLLKLTEEVDDDAIPVLYALVLYGGSHGLLTALGSRIGALIRE